MKEILAIVWLCCFLLLTHYVAYTNGASDIKTNMTVGFEKPFYNGKLFYGTCVMIGDIQACPIDRRH